MGGLGKEKKVVNDELWWLPFHLLLIANTITAHLNVKAIRHVSPKHIVQIYSKSKWHKGIEYWFKQIIGNQNIKWVIKIVKNWAVRFPMVLTIPTTAGVCDLWLPYWEHFPLNYQCSGGKTLTHYGVQYMK